jgi:hypothetical protein
MVRAEIQPVLVSPVVPSGPNFAFNYRADLSGDSRLDPAATNGITTVGPGGTLIQTNPPGTFFTIYDIPGLQSVVVSAPGWAATVQALGITPSNINASFDSPTLVNVTFSYTGPVVAGAVSLTGFQIVSSFSGVNPNGAFSDQFTNDTGASAGLTGQSVGPVAVPTPEPAGMGLLALGTAGLFARRRRS